MMYSGVIKLVVVVIVVVVKNLTIPAESPWTITEETPSPLPLFLCCYNDVAFYFSIFPNLQNNIWQGE